jgi:nicotinamide phosphoribosyltransferase
MKELATRDTQRVNLPAINLTDGYKLDHRRQYPTNTVKVYANLTPRKSRIPGIDSIVFFGLTYFIKDVLIEQFNKTFFERNKENVVEEYRRRVGNYLGPDCGITMEHIEALHDLGYMPVRIKALPEGSVVKCGVPVLTIVNTVPEFFWVPNFLETVISSEIWGMCTSATTAFNYRLLFDSYAMKTVGNTDFSSTFQGHDFSARGMFGYRAAAMSGAAHLTAFRGSDTMFAVDFLEHYYNANSSNELVAASVAATEHSVMCMGMKDGELATFRRLITEIYPKGIISIVSDTWDLWNVVNPDGGILATLKDEVLARDGKVVIRPDSGDPVHIIAGYDIFDDLDEIADLIREKKKLVFEDYDHSPITFTLYTLNQAEYDESCMEDGRGIIEESWSENWQDYCTSREICRSEAHGVVECLYEIFGGDDTMKGFVELNPHVGVIYGDSITLDRAKQICDKLTEDGFASTNWVAGIGSYTYQYQTRDTFGFAMKATYGEVKTEIGIEPREICKDPITDDGTKKSAKGLLTVLRNDSEFTKLDQCTQDGEEMGCLQVVFDSGQLLVNPTLAEIRELIDSEIKHRLKKETPVTA